MWVSPSTRSHGPVLNVTTPTLYRGVHYLVAADGYEHWQKFGLADEQHLIDWAREFVRPHRNLVDIGANVGIYSLELHRHVAQVHAFEPQRRTYYQLCGGIALSGAHNIWAYHTALGAPEERGQRRSLTVMGVDHSGSSLDPLKIAHEQRTLPGNIRGSEMVTMACLDDYGIGDIDLVKIDVEGWELPVIRGALQTLERSGWPRLLFEAWHEEFNQKAREELLAYVRALGYDTVPIRGWQHMWLATHRDQVKF